MTGANGAKCTWCARHEGHCGSTTATTSAGHVSHLRVGFWSHWWLEDHPIDVIDVLGGGFKSFFNIFYVHPYFGK